MRENAKPFGAKEGPAAGSVGNVCWDEDVEDEVDALDAELGCTSMAGNTFFLALVDPPGPDKTSGAFLLLADLRNPGFSASAGLLTSVFLVSAADFNSGFLPTADLLLGVPILVRFALDATLDKLTVLDLIRLRLDGALDRFIEDGPLRIPPVIFLVDARVVLPKGLVAAPLPSLLTSL